MATPMQRGSTTGANLGGVPDANREPSMKEIFKPAKRVGLDNAKKPAPQQPKAKKRFKIGRED